uniref:Uncharacterized protein n=1 Tax=Sinocyclocheilus anshuiensis TaxID=1608454 RepID=A0A671QV24_9TELE
MSRTTVFNRIIMVTMRNVSFLAPAGWILHYIPEYRQRAKPPPS